VYLFGRKKTRAMGFIRFYALVLLIGQLAPGVSRAGESQGLPPDWRSLPIRKFVAQADKVLAGEPPKATVEEIRSHAAELLSGLKPGANVPFDHLLALYGWGGSSLSSTERAAIEQILADRDPSQQVRRWSFWRMVKAYERMESLEGAEENREAFLLGWLENRDVDSIDDMFHVVWLCDKVSSMGSRTNQFSVRWTGSIQVPRDGDYVFWICPINVNTNHASNWFHQTTEVSIGKKVVLDSTQSGWTVRSARVPLEADRLEPLEVKFSYRLLNQQYMARSPAIAKLMWEGPGISQQVVPAGAFLLPDGTGSGLEAEYRVQMEDKEEISTRTEAAIDHVWQTPEAVLPKYPDLKNRLMARFCELALDPGYLAKWSNPETAPGKHAWWMQPRLLQHMDCTQQAECVAELLDRPALLASHPQPASAAEFYWDFRGADLDGALAVLGEWAQLHPDAEPEFVLPFEENAKPYIALVKGLVWQYRPHFDVLEDDYLELPDGGCCLPVAYIVSEGYLGEDRISEWVEKLDARLDEGSLSGDRRVNWLIARAYAEEIRASRGGRYFLLSTQHRVLAGRQWLEEAMLIAQSEPVRLRAYKELATRLAAEGHFDQARGLLVGIGNRVSQGPSAAAVAGWRKEVDRMEIESRRHREETVARSDNLHIENLRARHKRALESSNTEAARRYEQMITAAGAALE
jgi:hypothetical protein